MRGIILALLLTIVASTVFAQSHDTAEGEVLATEHQIARAWDAADSTKLASFIVDDFRGTTHTGHVVNKASLLKFVSGAGGGQSRYEDETVWVNGDVAVYTVRVTDSWTDDKGKSQRLVTQVTDILVRHNGQWKLKFGQETPVR